MIANVLIKGMIALYRDALVQHFQIFAGPPTEFRAQIKIKIGEK